MISPMELSRAIRMFVGSLNLKNFLGYFFRGFALVAGILNKPKREAFGVLQYLSMNNLSASIALRSSEIL